MGNSSSSWADLTLPRLRPSCRVVASWIVDLTAGPPSDADVPRYVAELGLPGLADIHIHFLPERMQKAVWATSMPPDATTGRDWPITYRAASPSDWPCFAGSGARDSGADLRPSRRHGRGSESLVRRVRGTCFRRRALRHVLPGTRRCGVHRPGDSHRSPAVQNPRPGGRVQSGRPTAERRLGAAGDQQAPGGDPLRLGTVAGAHTGVAPVRRLLDSHPDLVLVIAHPRHARVRRLRRPGMGVPGRLPRHHDGRHRLLQRLRPYPTATATGWRCSRTRSCSARISPASGTPTASSCGRWHGSIWAPSGCVPCSGATVPGC